MLMTLLLFNKKSTEDEIDPEKHERRDKSTPLASVHS